MGAGRKRRRKRAEARDAPVVHVPGDHVITINFLKHFGRPKTEDEEHGNGCTIEFGSDLTVFAYYSRSSGRLCIDIETGCDDVEGRVLRNTPDGVPVCKITLNEAVLHDHHDAESHLKESVHDARIERG